MLNPYSSKKNTSRLADAFLAVFLLAGLVQIGLAVQAASNLLPPTAKPSVSTVTTYLTNAPGKTNAPSHEKS